MRLLVLMSAVVALFSLGRAGAAIAADPDAIYGGSLLWKDHYGREDPVAVAMADFMDLVHFPNLRCGSDWAVIERTRGTYDWAKYDRKLQWVHSLGVKIVLVVGTAPEWATDSPPEARKILEERHHNNLIGCLPILDQYWPDYERYLREMVTRYRDFIDYYEMWNEPDGMAGPHVIRDANGRVVNVEYGGDAKWYAELLKHSYPIIKELDPTALVAAGSMESKGGLQTEFAQGIYDNGGQPYFDVISIHTYGYPFNFDWLRTIRGVMVRNGDAHKPMWITEYALNWQDKSEEAKAALARSALRYMRETPWISLSNFHFANIMWVEGEQPDELKPRPMAYAYGETTREKGPRQQFAEGFEKGIGYWYYDGAKATLTDQNVHSGKAALTAQGAGQITFLGSAYVAPPSTLEFWYYLQPDDAGAEATLEVGLYPGDISYRPVWVTFDGPVTIGKWARASIDLTKAFPQLAGKTIVDIGLRAKADPGALAFTIDDVAVQ